MILREFVAIAAGNLWRLKLRTGLTVAGVMIGIGALVTMLAFAAGIQKNATTQFEQLDLLHTLQVTPQLDLGNLAAVADSAIGSADSARTAPAVKAAVLDNAALEKIAALEGVTLVYPQNSFDAQVTWRDTERAVTAQALPAAFAARREFGTLLCGRFFESDSTREVVLGKRFVDLLGVAPDSILGDTLHIKVAGRAGLAAAFVGYMIRDLELPSLFERATELLPRALRLIFGASEIDLVICGVAEIHGGFGFRLHQVLMPNGMAAGLDRLTFSNPIELLSQLTAQQNTGYSLAIVTHGRTADGRAIRDAIEELGFRTFGFVDQLSEMRRAFMIFDLIIGIVGVIALIVASLGIVNTMIMSILERTREIGILKSLGAEDLHIRALFLVESGMIGLIGSSLGWLLGWTVSRLVSFIARRIMIAQDVPVIELFSLTPLLAFGAILFGIVLSLLAGLYPSGRAARIDPVRALRHE